MVLCAFAAHNSSLSNVVILQIRNTIQLKLLRFNSQFLILIQYHRNHCKIVVKERKIKLLSQMLKDFRYLNMSMRT